MSKVTNTVVQRNDSTLVSRSAVAPVKNYTEYKPSLRHDFFYACAYCTMSEYEAQAIRFCIDHYEPRNSRPDLINEYENLMYSCDECNSRKGDRCPPPEARLQDTRFFRPDSDIRSEHFKYQANNLAGLSNVGYYTIAALDLNRQALKRLRELRK